MVCPSTLRLSELSGGWVLGSVSFLEVTVAAGQVQRGEGTVSLLCLGVWGAGLAGDAPPRRKVGGALPIWVGGQPCALPSDREHGSTLGSGAPSGQLCPRVCGDGCSLCARQSQGLEQLCLCTTAQQLHRGGDVFACCWTCGQLALTHMLLVPRY